MRSGWIIAAAAAGLCGAPASARTGERFELLWRVKPQSVPAEAFWVREQGVVAASTLMPEAARVAERDLVGGRGEKLTPAGTHFAKVRTGGDVFCTVARRERGPADATRWLVDGRRLCVVDGATYFSVESGGYYWFSLPPGSRSWACRARS